MKSLHDGPGEGSVYSRRRFLQRITAILGSLVGLVLAIPFVSAVVGPSFRRSKSPWTRVGTLGPLNENQPISLSFERHATDAYLVQKTENMVWVVKDSSGSMQVFSPICPHLGCHVNWEPGNERFACPCHGSLFTPEGKVIGGPAPRPLDTLPWKMEKGTLYIRWERFEPGVPEKIRL